MSKDEIYWYLIDELDMTRQEAQEQADHLYPHLTEYDIEYDAYRIDEML